MTIRKILTAVFAVAVSLSSAQAASGSATAEEATAMVKKGVAFIKANGKDKGYAEIMQQAGPVHRP
jgi:cytochrome c